MNRNKYKNFILVAGIVILAIISGDYSGAAKLKIVEVTKDGRAVPGTILVTSMEPKENGQSYDLTGISSEVAEVLNPGFSITEDMNHTFGRLVEKFRPAFVKHGCSLDDLEVLIGHRKVEGVRGDDSARAVWVEVTGCLGQPYPSGVSAKCRHSWRGNGVYCSEQDMVNFLNACVDAIQALEPIKPSKLSTSKNHKDTNVTN